jgi:hypothetical protein
VRFETSAYTYVSPLSLSPTSLAPAEINISACRQSSSYDPAHSLLDHKHPVARYNYSLLFCLLFAFSFKPNYIFTSSHEGHLVTITYVGQLPESRRRDGIYAGEREGSSKEINVNCALSPQRLGFLSTHVFLRFVSHRLLFAMHSRSYFPSSCSFVSSVEVSQRGTSSLTARAQGARLLPLTQTSQWILAPIPASLSKTPACTDLSTVSHIRPTVPVCPIAELSSVCIPPIH